MKILIKIMLLGVLVIFAACEGNQQNNNEEEKEHEHTDIVSLNKEQQSVLGLTLGHFEMRNITNVIKINGELKVPPVNTAEVTAFTGGNVKDIKVFSGTKVKKGQILAVLEHPAYIQIQEDFARTANDLEYLEQEYERQKKLYENNVSAGKEFQKAKRDYLNAKSKYMGLKEELLMLNLSPGKIKNGKISGTINILSPIDGYVSKVNVNLGTYINGNDTMFEIIDNTKLHADFMVFEKDLPFVKQGGKIHFVVSNLPEKEHVATVFAIEKKFDEENRSIVIHAKIEGNTAGLIPGMFITGHLHSNRKFVKTLPEEAIVKDGEKYYIFVVDNDMGREEHPEAAEGSIHLRPVEVIPGTVENKYMEIKPLEDIPENALIALNSAYFLLSELKKNEMEHHH